MQLWQNNGPCQGQEQLLEAFTDQQHFEKQEPPCWEFVRKEAQVSSLCGGACQRDLLEPIPKEKTMVEQTRLVHQLQQKEASLSQNRSRAAHLEQLQAELSCSKQAHQVQMEQLQGQLHCLQQEMKMCGGPHQDNFCQMQTCEGTQDEQTLDLELLLQQCQLLKDQLFYYEEVTQKQEFALSQQCEQKQHLQEQLIQAENSLELYRQKFQASLGRSGELENQLQRLQVEASSQATVKDNALFQLQSERLVLQKELRDKCCQVSRAENSLDQLTRDLQAARTDLAQGRQLSRQSEKTIQELQEQLAAAHMKLLDQEQGLAVLHRDFTSYKATHSCSNSTYEAQIVSTEALKQKLLQAEAECAQYEQQAEEYQCLAQDLKMELGRLTEQKSSTLKDLAQLEGTVQCLQQEAMAQREHHQQDLAEWQQRLQHLEDELRQSRKLCILKEKAVQKRDELLRKSRAEMVRARSALQEKGQEVEQQRAAARTLETNLQETQHELEHVRLECASLKGEVQDLQQDLRESQMQQQHSAQELAQQEEQVLLTKNSLRSVQDQLSERAAEISHHVQVGQRLEAELQMLKEKLSRTGAELEQKRCLLEQLAEELCQAKQQNQAISQEAQQQLQTKAELMMKLERSQEALKCLQQQAQGQGARQEMLRSELNQQRCREEDLQRQLRRATEREQQLAQELQDLHRQLQSTELQLQEEEHKGRSMHANRVQQETEKQALQEQLQQHVTQLESTRHTLDQAQMQLQQQTAELLRQEAALAQLHTELHALQEREQQSSNALGAARTLAHDLKLQATSFQASQREAEERLKESMQQVSCFQRELQLAQNKAALLEKGLADSQEQVAQLRSQLKALQRVREEETASTQERLSDLGKQIQHWEEQHWEASRALAEREEELVVAKVEVASLEEKVHNATEEREVLQSEVNLLRQKFVLTSQEVDSLQCSLEAARLDSHRLHHESEGVVANVSQWVKEQKLVNEKLGHKIRNQIKQIAQLTGEREHLHGLQERLQQENKCLRNEVDELRIECERLKALHDSDFWNPSAILQQPCLALPEEDSPYSTRRRNKALAAKWNIS